MRRYQDRLTIVDDLCLLAAVVILALGAYHLAHRVALPPEADDLVAVVRAAGLTAPPLPVVLTFKPTGAPLLTYSEKEQTVTIHRGRWPLAMLLCVDDDCRMLEDWTRRAQTPSIVSGGGITASRWRAVGARR